MKQPFNRFAYYPSDRNLVLVGDLYQLGMVLRRQTHREPVGRRLARFAKGLLRHRSLESSLHHDAPHWCAILAGKQVPLRISQLSAAVPEPYPHQNKVATVGQGAVATSTSLAWQRGEAGTPIKRAGNELQAVETVTLPTRFKGGVARQAIWETYANLINKSSSSPSSESASFSLSNLPLLSMLPSMKYPSAT